MVALRKTCSHTCLACISFPVNEVLPQLPGCGEVGCAQGMGVAMALHGRAIAMGLPTSSPLHKMCKVQQ